MASGYLLPFMFAYDPALLGHFSSGLSLGLLSVLTAVLTIASLSIVLYGYYLTKLNWMEIGLAALSTIGFLAYFFTRGDMMAVVAGAVCFALLTLSQLLRKSKEKMSG